jgi:putative YhdH/YhfP family quinone oxidoreductase
MEPTTPFKAWIVRKENDHFSRTIETRMVEELPAGEVLVKVYYSSLNYKDALSAIGNRGVTRRYPHTPGIDAVGIVAESTTPAVKKGTAVIVSCYDLGMNTDGGFGQYIRVPAEWVVVLPKTLSMQETMGFGTAGFTAALSVHKLLQQGIKPDQGPVLVTGASGGVGSVAVSILAKEGFEVVAASGKDAGPFLLSLGAKKVISREAVNNGIGKAMLRPKWAGVVDTVGGNILAYGLKTTKPCGAVTSCGNVASGELPITVYPFILRGITLLGIDAAECPLELRKQVWDSIAGKWKLEHLSKLTTEITMVEIDEYIDTMLAGKTTGRIIVDMQQE